MFHGEVKGENQQDLRNHLEPQQVGLAPGGAAKLVHPIRMSLEEHPDFICATNDCL